MRSEEELVRSRNEEHFIRMFLKHFSSRKDLVLFDNDSISIAI